MKKAIMPITFIICFLALMIVGSGGVFEDIKINGYEAEITLTESGDAVIYEKYTYYYSGDYSAKYRDIDTLKYNPDNPIAQSINDSATLVLSQGVTNSVTVTIDGTKLESVSTDELRFGNDLRKAYVGTNGDYDELGYSISCDGASSECQSLFVYAPRGFGEETIFEYRYEIKGIISMYNDIASLNWKMFSYNEANVKNGKVTINLPSNSYGDDLHLWARGASKDGKIVLDSSDKMTITFGEVPENFPLEIRLLTNKNIFPNVNSINKVDASVLDDIMEMEESQAIQDNIRITVATVLYYGMFALVVVMVFVFVHAYKKYDKEYKPNFEGDYLRQLPSEDLTPAEMSYLYYFGGINDEDVTATLLDLIRKGYLKLDTLGERVTEEDPNFEISVTENKDYSELKPHEEFLLTWFISRIGDGEKVTIKQIEGYPSTEEKANKFMRDSAEFIKLCKNEGKKHGFIESAKDKIPAYNFSLIPLVYFIISLLTYFLMYADTMLPMIVSGILLVMYSIYVTMIKRRTHKGCEEFAKWKAFKHFLEDFSSMKDYPMPGVVIWEQFLVYATSLKIADTVMEQLTVKLPNIDSEIDDSTFMRYNYNRSRGSFYSGYFLGSISRSYSNAKTIGHQTIARANAERNSANGRGGGFSGGSSFGGGGGGGRSR